MKAVCAAILGTAAFVSTAQAHQVWIEQSGKNATLRFGEFGENLRETSPGLLDKFVAPKATLINAKGEQPLTLSKNATGFALSGAAGKGDTIIAEEASYAISEYKKDDKTVRSAWTPAARYITGFTAQEPKLTFDIVPTGEPGEFRLYYKGKPVPKSKVVAVVQSGWAREAYSDDAGVVKFAMPWRGTYVLEAQYTDKAAGERDGKPYDFSAFVTSLTFEQAKGVAAVAAGPAATPNK
jgi:uncharacterized GH25 family protein